MPNPTCAHPKPLSNVGTRPDRTAAARAWCPACKADTGWLDGTRANALEALTLSTGSRPAAVKPPTPEKPEA